MKKENKTINQKRGEYAIFIKDEQYCDENGNPYLFNSYEEANSFVEQNEIIGADIVRQHGRIDDQLNGAFYECQTPTRYEIYKDRARDEAIEFSITSSAYNYSYGELLEKQQHFEKLAKRYGLIKEFRENGIC